MITLNSAYKLKEHISTYIPNARDLKIANLSRLGSRLDGEGVGEILSLFITNSWDEQLVPIIVMDDVSLGHDALITVRINVLNKLKRRMCKSFGIYWVNIYDIPTKKRVIEMMESIEDVFIIRTM